MTKIYLVRHGQTDWNKELVFRGRKDIPLNELGNMEAQSIAHVLKKEKIDAIYASPLKRAIQTARQTSQILGIKIEPIAEFIDINYGKWEGLTFSEVQNRYKEQYTLWEKSPEKVRFPGGETLEEARDRSFIAFNSIIKNNPNKSLLIISHRVINKLLLCAILDIDNSNFWRIRQDTACINVVEFSHEMFILEKMNDTCHLTGIDYETVQKDF
jgi:phosphoserine phosphatase